MCGFVSKPEPLDQVLATKAAVFVFKLSGQIGLSYQTDEWVPANKKWAWVFLGKYQIAPSVA